ncbi:MAG: hypothetical protein KAT56_04835 [Sedimentisphaerales bacterium]|nr:hypothetical protein [Sedimentisphaerales bacterium]
MQNSADFVNALILLSARQFQLSALWRLCQQDDSIRQQDAALVIAAIL